jgi:hypothetical protein
MGKTLANSPLSATVSILRPGQLFLKIHNLFDLHQKPPVNLREVEDLLEGEASAQGVADEEDAFGIGHAQLAADDVAREDVAVTIDFRADAPGFVAVAERDGVRRTSRSGWMVVRCGNDLSVPLV